MRKSNMKIYQEIIHNLLGNKCKNCGEIENLHIHHKDKKHTNNKIENIELLCKKCHFHLHKIERIKMAAEVYNNKSKSKLKEEDTK